MIHVHIHSAGTISLSLYVAILSSRLWEYEDVVYHLNMTMNKKFHEEKMRMDWTDASASDLMSEVGRLNATVLTTTPHAPLLTGGTAQCYCAHQDAPRPTPHRWDGSMLLCSRSRRTSLSWRAT